MVYVSNPVTWVGVVVQTADGKTWAVEMDGSHSLITAEITQTAEIPGDHGFGRLGPLLGAETTVEVHITGRGTPWRFGQQAAPKPRPSIGGQSKAITPRDVDQ